MTRKPRSHVRSFKKTNLDHIALTMKTGCPVVAATEQKNYLRLLETNWVLEESGNYSAILLLHFHVEGSFPDYNN